jgi:Rhodopirellula transposase DDE domain
VGISGNGGKAIPYRVYDLAANTGWVAVGTDHDTAAFAVATITRWWEAVGQAGYPGATKLFITADGGGSNGYRSRQWKPELTGLAACTGLDITVCHLPPGTSKWNKIEHRLFSHISMNWRGRPLTSHEVIVETIGPPPPHRPERPRRTRPGHLPHRHQDPRQADQSPPDHRHPAPTHVPRRMELHPARPTRHTRLKLS